MEVARVSVPESRVHGTKRCSASSSRFAEQAGAADGETALEVMMLVMVRERLMVKALR